MDFEKLKPQIAELAQKNGLELVVLFGSQATGRTNLKSDIDIAVLSKKAVNRARLSIEFDEIFKRDDTEVVDLALASPTLMREVVADGRILYEKESDLFFKWKLYAIKIWMETGWLRKLADRKTREWTKSL